MTERYVEIAELIAKWSGCWCGVQMSPDHDPRVRDCPQHGDDSCRHMAEGIVVDLRALPRNRPEAGEQPCCCECSPPEFGGNLPDRECPHHGDPSNQSEAQVTCPTCGPTATEKHPRHPSVLRCTNCKEWLHDPHNRPGAGES